MCLCVSGPSVPPVWRVSTGRPERLLAGTALSALLLQSMLGAALHCTGQRWHGSGWVERECMYVVIKAGIGVDESYFVRVSVCLSMSLLCVCVCLFVCSDTLGKLIWAYVFLPHQQTGIEFNQESYISHLKIPFVMARKHCRTLLDVCAQVCVCV